MTTGITVTDAIRDEDPSLWIINTSSEQYEGGADVFITITGKGGPSLLTVKRTWLPEQVTDRFPKKQILESMHFTNAVRQGLVKVISPKEAQAILNRPGADVERRRLRELDITVKEAVASKGIGKNVMISTGDEERDRELSADKKGNFINLMETLDEDTVAAAEKEMDDEVSAAFRGFVLKLNRYDDSEIELAQNDLRLHGDMSIPEATYLVKNLKFEKITSKIQKKIKALAE